MIYPRLSPDGSRVAGGNELIELDGVLIPPIPGDDKPYGTSPVWYSPNSILYTYSSGKGPQRPLDGQLVRYDLPSQGGSTVPYLYGIQSGNILVAGGRQFAIWRPDIGVRRSVESVNHPDWTNPALSDTGVFAHSILGDGITNIAVNSSTIARENQGRIEVFVDAFNPQGQWQDWTPEPNCGKPIPVWTGREIFILFHTHDGSVFLAEFATKLGYPIKPRNWDGGSGYTHDAKLYDANHIRVVSPGFDSLIDITGVRSTLPPVILPPDPEPEPEPPDPEPEPEPEPEPPHMACTPIPRTSDVLAASFDRISDFCAAYRVPDSTNVPDQFPPGSAPYINDAAKGAWFSQGLCYFMFGDTGKYAQVIMNPDDKRPLDQIVAAAEASLFDYMKKRCGDFT